MAEKLVCQPDACTGCMACIDSCAKNAITIKDTLYAYNAVIDRSKCVNCNRCHNVCQNNQKKELLPPKKWVQGWSSDGSLRSKAASGGAATAIARAFIEEGGIVYGCTFYEGNFIFKSAETQKDLEAFTGSKYVKSNPTGIYKNISEKLQEGNRVLFIGLPCQVYALKIYIGEKNQNNLYTVDLICHGTPSPKLLGNFLAQYNISLKNIQNISFRHKEVFGLEQNHHPVMQPGAVDPYSLAFLHCLDYTDNCYQCPYAGINRGSDITVGDSWGTDLPESEQQKGISLILCQTEKGIEILKKAKVTLFPVDLQNAISNNQQLKEPSRKTKDYYAFAKHYQKRRKFNSAVFHSVPGKYIRQEIKAFILKFKIIRGSKIIYTLSIKP